MWKNVDVVIQLAVYSHEWFYVRFPIHLYVHSCGDVMLSFFCGSGRQPPLSFKSKWCSVALWCQLIYMQHVFIFPWIDPTLEFKVTSFNFHFLTWSGSDKRRSLFMACSWIHLTFSIGIIKYPRYQCHKCYMLSSAVLFVNVR